MSEAAVAEPVRPDVEIVRIRMGGSPPPDYHCTCRFCGPGGYRGELIRADGTHYSKFDRNAYYVKGEASMDDGHIAKTPLHIARWATQSFTKEDDWVMDPTIGAGTTAVEALRLGRNAAGMEIQFIDIVKKNIEVNNPFGKLFRIRHGDARNVGAFLAELKNVARFTLVVNNPPYSGDVRQQSMGAGGVKDATYDPRFANLAFLKEGQEYWDTIKTIYGACADALEPGGHFVVGVKDMMHKKKPYLLHMYFAEILEAIGLEHAGTVLLRHWPTTMFINTYEKIHGAKPPLFQTIIVFRKK